MSPFLTFFYNLFAAIMAPSLFSWGTSKPTEIEAPTKLSAEEQEAQEAQERETFQKAVREALNNEDFTKAVASQLALQLQPTLKAASETSALVLESKILASNEQLSKSVNESDTQTASKLTDLGTSNIATAAKISALEEAVAQISASVSELTNTVKAVQEKVASLDTSALSSHTTSLDTISTNLQTLQEKGPAPIAAALGSHATKLDSIITDLAAVKEKSDVSSLAKDLAAIKTSIESGASVNTSGFSGLGSQIGSAIAAIEAQNGTLADIKNADTSKEILAATKDSHTAHSSALSEIKSIGKFY
jgi:hypothetical protein